MSILNVGAGSTTVVAHPSGHITMVDVNDGGEQRSYEQDKSVADLTDPIDWVLNVYGEDVFRFVLSHPDADHMAGLRRILLDKDLNVQNFWDLAHTRSRTEADCRTKSEWVDWLAYDGLRHRTQLDNHTWPKRLTPLRNDQRDYWRQDDIEILSPDQYLVDEGCRTDSYNDASFVLRFGHGPTSSVLLASDVEEPAWNDMIAEGINLRANVLVASHHGRRSGFSKEALEAIRPEVVVVSTGKLPPEHDALPMYKQRCDHVFSTRTHGDLLVRMGDGGRISVYAEDGTLLTALVDRV